MKTGAAMLGAWVLLIAAILLNSIGGLITGIVVFTVPFLVGILMCRECYKNEIPISGVLFGGILWIILNAILGGILMQLAAHKHLIPTHSPEESTSLLLVCLIYTVELCVVPLVMTLTWRLILMAVAACRERKQEKSGKSVS